jgi:hypothetical protein
VGNGDASAEMNKSGIITSDIPNTETHAQQLHKAPGHGWKHYFFEFFMLFLAVFCGFLAENLREEKVEKNREKEYIETMIADLKEDTSLLNKSGVEFKQKEIELDSLFQLLTRPDIKEYGSALYYYGRKANRFSFFTSIDRTIQQMKNSGAFRLIKNNDAADNILKYYSELSQLYLLQNNTNNLTMEYRSISYTLFDPVIFETIVNDKTQNEVSKPTGNPLLTTYDKGPIQRVCANLHYMQGSTLVLQDGYNRLKKHAVSLIAQLKKEYHQE